MWEYLTVPELQRRNVTLLTEDRNGTRMQRARQRSVDGSSFLSHSSGDVDLLPAVVELLENHGAEVYLDKKDPALPPFTDRKTASVLRQRISDCRTFILFATTNSKDSRWVPWELGLADGLKRGARVAILPSVDSVSDVAWAEREYLGLYDRIVYGDLKGEPKKVWMVLNQEENRATKLTDWLKAF